MPLNQVPVWVQQAVLSAEDRSFYTNYGFDPVGIARAAWNQAQGGSGGGSTITQQYVKNVLVGDEYSLWRKYREVVIATKINQEQSKEEILGNYLNTIYFGRGAYGIQAAAQAYYGRDVATLTPSEGAVLAGLIQAPSKWDPAVDRGMSQQRWTFVLDGMVAQRWLSPADRAAAVFPATIPPSQRRSGIPENDRGHIVSAVQGRARLLRHHRAAGEPGGSAGHDDDRPEAPAAGGRLGARRRWRASPRTSARRVVSIDPRTGAILAYYGGKDGVGLRLRPGQAPAGLVVQAVRAAGRARAATRRSGSGKTYDGSTPQTIAGTKVANSEGESCPNCDLKTAMTLSINTVFYQLGVDVGPQKVADAAHQAGVSAPLDEPLRRHLDR